MLLNYNDKDDNNDNNENTMEGIILNNNFIKANEEEIEEINFILDAINKDNNYKSFLQHAKHNAKKYLVTMSEDKQFMEKRCKNAV